MHVALNGYFWNQPHTGSGQYTRQLVYHLNRLVSDLDLTLIFPQPPGGAEPEQLPPSVRIHRVPLRPGHLGKVIFEQLDFPRACTAVGAELAHVPYWGSPLRSPVPVIVTIHDLITMIFREYQRSPAAKFYNALVATSARGAAHVLTDSNASRQDIIKRLKIPAAHVSTVYLAPAPHFKPDGDFLLDMAIKQKYDLPDFYTLYLGGYTLHKNITTLLLAYTYVSQGVGSQYPLVLAGKKPVKSGPHVPDYDTYIKKLGLEERVRWLGYVAEEDKPVIDREAMSFVFPSRYEGFGLPPLEAMACNVPVVASAAPGVDEIVGQAAMSVDPNDERQMAGAIIATLIQDNLADELRAKGRERVKAFSWEKTAAETVAVYAKALE